jgi:ribosomal-protein-alanine N-acetyltransferase
VLAVGERIIGHGILSAAAGEGHLLNVCIRRDEQGHGHGRELVIQMLKRALAREVSVVFLEVRPSNQVAIALYDSLGFNEVGRRQGYYPAEKGREDALVLAMQLDTGWSGL